MLMGSLLLPVFLLFIYKIVLGEQVHKVTGVDSVYGVVPMCAVISALFGSLGNSVGITMDRESRLLSRMWILPIHRASAVTGWVIAEVVRAFIGTILITVIGVAMGLRFTQVGLRPYFSFWIPSIVVTGFTALVMAMAIRNNGRTAMTWLLGVTFALAFVNPVPLNQAVPGLGSAIDPHAADIAAYRDHAVISPWRSNRCALRDNFDLGCRAARRVPPACGARIPVVRGVQRVTGPADQPCLPLRA